MSDAAEAAVCVYMLEADCYQCFFWHVCMCLWHAATCYLSIRCVRIQACVFQRRQALLKCFLRGYKHRSAKTYSESSAGCLCVVFIMVYAYWQYLYQIYVRAYGFHWRSVFHRGPVQPTLFHVKSFKATLQFVWKWTGGPYSQTRPPTIVEDQPKKHPFLNWAPLRRSWIEFKEVFV